MTIFELHQTRTCCEHCGDHADEGEIVVQRIVNRQRAWWHQDCWEALRDAFPAAIAYIEGKSGNDRG